MDTAELLVDAAALVGMFLVALMAVIPTAMETGPDGGRAPRRSARPRPTSHAPRARPLAT